MAKLHWYEYERGKGLPIHSEWDPTEGVIYIRRDDPKLEPHAALSHELAHFGRGPGGIYSWGSISEEIRAWEVTIENLMKVGEWTPETREQAIWALSSYFEEHRTKEEAEQEARWLVREIEDRVKWKV